MSAGASATYGHRHPLLLGHRGCRGKFPENTLAAFEHALASGCDGFEFDVRLTGDKKPIICHNSRIGTRYVSRNRYEHFFNNNAKTKLSMFGRSTAAEICCLQDVVFRYSDRAFLYIELKVSGLEEITIAALRSGPKKPGYVVASFLPKVIRVMHKLAPEVPLGFIFDSRAGLKRWQELPVGYVMPNVRLVTEARIEAMHAAGKQVMTWTVNSPKRMRQLAEWGIDGIVSDDPVLLGHTFGRDAGLPPQ